MKQSEVKGRMKVKINERARNGDNGIVDPVGKTGTVVAIFPSIIEVRLDRTRDTSAWHLLFKPECLDPSDEIVKENEMEKVPVITAKGHKYFEKLPLNKGIVSPSTVLCQIKNHPGFTKDELARRYYEILCEDDLEDSYSEKEFLQSFKEVYENLLSNGMLNEVF